MTTKVETITPEIATEIIEKHNPTATAQAFEELNNHSK